MDNKLIAEALAKVLSDFTFRILADKKDVETAFNETRDNLHNQTGLDKIICANMVRLAVATYMNNKEYLEGSVNAIIKHLEETQ